mmetsp:Transcript_2579/g.3453  ORF Transcript_2579/g.3453 Transcript_2579/m.3453 type:complete len:87 (-) Transcript_2579:43-303(-)
MRSIFLGFHDKGGSNEKIEKAEVQLLLMKKKPRETKLYYASPDLVVSIEYASRIQRTLLIDWPLLEVSLSSIFFANMLSANDQSPN